MTTQHANPDPTPITLTAADGQRLGATRFAAHGAVKGHVVIAGATGVHQSHYARFAEFMAAQGYHALTFDYRGIGHSAPDQLEGFAASALDWAQLDVAAAIDAMSHSSLPLFYVGHSFGGQVLGLAPNHGKVRRAWMFGSGSGWHGWMPWPERLRVVLAMNTLCPLIVAWKDYLAWKWLGMGEDLPEGVFRQWRQWCSRPRYFFEVPDMAKAAAHCAFMHTPMVCANATDDLWAGARARDAFMAGYSGAPWKGVDLRPSDFALKAIGHMGYFRSASKALWPAVLDAFESPAPAHGDPRS